MFESFILAIDGGRIRVRDLRVEYDYQIKNGDWVKLKNKREDESRLCSL